MIMKKKLFYETPEVNLILIPLESAICLLGSAIFVTLYGATNEDFEELTFEF